MYYLYSENKGADLRLCFRIRKKKRFSHDEAHTCICNGHSVYHDYIVADIIRVLYAWENPRLLHATAFAKKYEPLLTFTDHVTLQCHDYVRITGGILKILDFLHERDLMQDDFAVDDIRVDTTDIVSFFAISLNVIFYTQRSLAAGTRCFC